MANAQIKYDSSAKTLLIPNINSFRKTMNQERYDDFSASGKAQHINIRQWDEITITAAQLEKKEVYKLYEWWSFAREGNTFSFALYSSQDAITVLSSGASAGQTVIKTTGTDGFAINDWVYMNQSTGERSEVIQLSSITANVSVKATTNLKYSYTTGDNLRHIDYWRTVSVKDDRLSIPANAPGKLHNVTINLIEEK